MAGTSPRTQARYCWDRLTEPSGWCVASLIAISIGAALGMSRSRSRRWRCSASSHTIMTSCVRVPTLAVLAGEVPQSCGLTCEPLAGKSITQTPGAHAPAPCVGITKSIARRWAGWLSLLVDLFLDQIAEAKRLCMASRQPARVVRGFQYRTIDSWNRTRRASPARPSTRWRALILASSSPHSSAHVAYDVRALYEDLYWRAS